MDTKLTIEEDFDADSRGSPGTKYIADRGGSFFMVGDSRMAIYETDQRTELRYWNEMTSAWESTWDDVSFPRGTKFLATTNARRAMMGTVDLTTAEMVEVHPFVISHLNPADGSMHIVTQPILRFHTPILSLHFSFDTDYLFALSTTHVYYWNADTPSTPPIRECELHGDYRGVPVYARGASLFFLYDGNAGLMDEFDGSSGEWARWTLGHDDDGSLPTLNGLRGQRRLTMFAPELITLFAVSVDNNSLWSLDAYDPFWKRLGDLTQDGTAAEIVSTDGRTVFVRAGEEIVAVTVVPDYHDSPPEKENVKEEQMEEDDEETKQLKAELEAARAKRDGQLSKLRKIGVMLLDAGVDGKILAAIESGLDQWRGKAADGEDAREKMRREIESIEKSEPLYKLKLMKYMTMISQSERKEKKEEQVEQKKVADEVQKESTEPVNVEDKMDYTAGEKGDTMTAHDDGVKEENVKECAQKEEEEMEETTIGQGDTMEQKESTESVKGDEEMDGIAAVDQSEVMEQNESAESVKGDEEMGATATVDQTEVMEQIESTDSVNGDEETEKIAVDETNEC